MRRHIVPYNSSLKERARELRNHSTLSEVLLWKRLKGRQMRRFDFHRQKPLGNYIVDFYCSELLLAIEIDGSSHDGRYDEDQIRQESLELRGVSFLRFDDRLVKRDIETVLGTIEAWIEEHADDVLRQVD
jgi:very-short-patch-repair endonuclease